jgi:hypothetical protein
MSVPTAKIMENYDWFIQSKSIYSNNRFAGVAEFKYEIRLVMYSKPF